MQAYLPVVIAILAVCTGHADSTREVGFACATTAGDPCAFPFTYQSTVYNSCTTVDNGDTPWCYTEADAVVGSAYGNCADSTGDSTGDSSIAAAEDEYQDTAGGTLCKSVCGDLNNGGSAPWCYTKYNEDDSWGYCGCPGGVPP